MRTMSKNNVKRAMVYDIIEAHPGIYRADLVETLKGTLQYQAVYYYVTQMAALGEISVEPTVHGWMLFATPCRAAGRRLMKEGKQ